MKNLVLVVLLSCVNCFSTAYSSDAELALHVETRRGAMNDHSKGVWSQVYVINRGNHVVRFPANLGSFSVSNTPSSINVRCGFSLRNTRTLSGFAKPSISSLGLVDLAPGEYTYIGEVNVVKVGDAGSGGKKLSFSVYMDERIAQFYDDIWTGTLLLDGGVFE